MQFYNANNYCLTRICTIQMETATLFYSLITFSCLFSSLFFLLACAETVIQTQPAEMETNKKKEEKKKTGDKNA